MGNVVSTDAQIHKRFDLKGSSHGRSTVKVDTEGLRFGVRVSTRETMERCCLLVNLLLFPFHGSNFFHSTIVLLTNFPFAIQSNRRRLQVSRVRANYGL